MKVESPLYVRKASLGDLYEAAMLLDECRQAQGLESDVREASELLRRRMGKGESVLFLAQKGDSMVGFAQIVSRPRESTSAPTLVLSDLFVRTQARRHGIATRLLQAIEFHSWARGAERLIVEPAPRDAAVDGLFEVRGWRRDVVHGLNYQPVQGGTCGAQA